MGTPHLKPLKKGIAHGRNSYSESEKAEYSKETPVFAYMRRSTNKLEQEDSLEKQEDCIDEIALKHEIDERRIIAFTETRSGFENRKRPKFNEMIKAIDKLKTPCILLAYDSSRLSRNQKDSREIVDRIFGDNGAKANIQEVIFFEDRSWNKRSNKDEVYQTLLDNFKESVHTGKRSRDGSLKQLRNGIYTWTPPRGLEHVKKGDKILYMRQNEQMPLVRKAFEMKMAGTTHKKISKYLKENGIKIGERELTERYFGNTIYIGTYRYTDKTTGEVKDYPVKFFEGKPPISMTLWQGVQENRGKKKDNYGDKQSYFALGELLRTEEGRRLSGYFQKGTAQYKNTTERIHISDKWIVEEFVAFLRKSIYTLILNKRLAENNILGPKMIEEIVAGIIDNKTIYIAGGEVRRDWKIPKITPELEQAMEEAGRKIKLKYPDLPTIKPQTPEEFYKSKAQWQYTEWEVLVKDFESYKMIHPNKTKKNWEGFKVFMADKEKTIAYLAMVFENIFEVIGGCIYDFDTVLKEVTEGSKHEHRETIEKNKASTQTKIKSWEKRQQEIENEMRTMRKNFLKMGGIDGMEEAFREEIKALEQEKKVLDEKIHETENEEDFDLLIAKIPNILKNTFELLGKSFTEKENKDLKEDIYDLIKLTAFELKIKKKKALEIELFGPVRQVLFGENVGMEAPAGVEPASRALQAPV